MKEKLTREQINTLSAGRNTHNKRLRHHGAHSAQLSFCEYVSFTRNTRTMKRTR